MSIDLKRALAENAPRSADLLDFEAIENFGQSPVAHGRHDLRQTL